MNRSFLAPLRLRTLFLLFLALGTITCGTHAADLKLEAKLVWGANDSPDKVQYKLVGGDLAAGLRHNLNQWTNYYEITNLTAVIPLNESRDVKMSDHCTLRIRNLGSSRIAVDCIGQGKQVSQGTNTLPAKWLVLGGNATNHTAWFVGLRSLDQAPADNSQPPVKK